MNIRTTSPRSTRNRTRLRVPAVAGTALGAGILLALAAPLAASAHVTVGPDTAEPGSYALVDFRVPNESASATTTAIAVDLPTDTPFVSVSFIPVPGWTTELTTTTLPAPVKVGDGEVTEAVTRVTWTADDGVGLGDHSLQLFPLSLGPVPDVGSLSLPVEQTYSDGSVVDWNEENPADGEAEHPAPVLYVNDAPVAHHDDDGDDDGAAAVPDHSADAAHEDAAASATAQPDVLARVLGILGLVVGAVGIVVGVTSRRKSA